MKTTSDFSIPWGIIIKLLVSGGLIAWLFQTIDVARVVEIIQDLNGSILGIVLVLIWLTLMTIAKRWQLVIRLGDIQASFLRLTEATFIGAFFNQFLPSSVGGDFFRILSARKEGATLNEAVTGVFIDRLFGFISLGALCILVIPVEGQILLASSLKWPFVLTMALLLSVCGGGVILLFIPTSWHSFVLIRPLSPLIKMICRALQQKALLFSLVLSSLASSIIMISSVQVLMMAFDVSLTWKQGMAILPVVLLLSSLPISFAGWGLREGAMVLALGVYGVSQETALALSLIYGVLQLISGLPGLILWILEKRRLGTQAS